MKFVFITLFVLLPITPLWTRSSDFKLPSRRSIIAETLAYVVENMGYETSSGFHVSYSSVSKKSAHRQASIINDFLLKTAENFLVNLDDIRYFNRNQTEARKFTLLLIDSTEAFENMEPILKTHLYDTSGKHLVLVSEELSHNNAVSLIQKVFDEFFRNYIVNVELMLRNSTTGFMDVYNFFPVSRTYCFKVIPVLHSTFDGSQSKKSFNLFPRKFENFFGCPLSVVTFPFPPHVFLKNDKDNVKGSGIDIRVLYGVAEKLNFSVVIVDSKERGVQYPNGTLTGAIKMLYENQGNITIGGYGSAAKAMLLFSPSVAYLHTAMVFAIPPMQEYSPLERLLLPFDFDVWFAIGLTFGLTFFTLLVLSAWKKSYRDLVFGSTVRYPIFEMIVVYLGGAVARFPKGCVARNVILQWLIVSLVLSSCYKAILFGMLKEGFLKKFPSTVEGMLNEGYVIDVPLPLMQNLKDGPLGGRESNSESGLRVKFFVSVRFSVGTTFTSWFNFIIALSYDLIKIRIVLWMGFYIFFCALKLVPRCLFFINYLYSSFYLLKYTIHTHYAILQSGKAKRMVIDTNIQLQHFNSIYYEAGILNSLPQRLFIFPMYFYYSKESFLVDPIDEVLKRFVQSGLITFWQDSVLNVSHLEKTQASNIMNPLQVKHFQSCFALCGVLVVCSIVAFILEIISLRMNFIKRILLCTHSMHNK